MHPTKKKRTIAVLYRRVEIFNTSPTPRLPLLRCAWASAHFTIICHILTQCQFGFRFGTDFAIQSRSNKHTINNNQ